MSYRLRYLDPSRQAALDEQNLEHCNDEASARRWMSAQRSGLPIQLLDHAGAVIASERPATV